MQIKLDLLPFNVPDTVLVKGPIGRRQDGWKPLDRIPLKDLDLATLNGLIEEFRIGVYEKAGIKFQNPRIVGSNSVENYIGNRGE